MIHENYNCELVWTSIAVVVFIIITLQPAISFELAQEYREVGIPKYDFNSGGNYII